MQPSSTSNGYAGIPYAKSRITIQMLQEAAQTVVRLHSLESVPQRARKEHWVQGAVLGYLEPRVGGMELEHGVENGRGKRKGSIDFYQKGNPPSAVELVVISGKYDYAARPRLNKTEVSKLRALKYPAKVRRFLVFVDLRSPKPKAKKKLQTDYRSYFGSQGYPNNITAVYAHKDAQYDFSF